MVEVREQEETTSIVQLIFLHPLHLPSQRARRKTLLTVGLSVFSDLIFRWGVPTYKYADGRATDTHP